MLFAIPGTSNAIDDLSRIQPPAANAADAAPDITHHRSKLQTSRTDSTAFAALKPHA
jgi:hypothetical protein